MNPLWIDTDMGFDDLASVLAVTGTPGWSVAGLSLVAGNAPLPVVIDNALRSAACFGWSFPIHAGAAGPLVGELETAQAILGGDAMRSAGRSLPPQRTTLSSEDAVGALAAWLRASPTPATILALGPLTNIALLMRRHPELAARIGELMWMGGSAGPGNHTAAAEFNAYVDPESINEVLAAGLPLAMVGLDTCRQVRVDKADADALRALGTDRGMLIGDLLEGYVRIAGADGRSTMALYDPTATAALLAPGSISFTPAHLVAECSGEHTRGMTVVEWRVPRKAQANARIATTADAAAVRAVVLGGLAAVAR
ncbi:nucleoside hydrolase [Ramlibacter sp. G-1-2-2]|uniref:Nucleoside hydrolase n=1 Tax=Ramlibacter agri TaxID=2728837 RepID=A0A848GYR0_9BURK|nr:nucleoside hydrolase [Ramlibacter agri]NML43307.1 nucleoside hydrolase [Ramlibacter agri]